MENANKTKVAIHTMNWVTKDGNTCLAWPGYRVAVGPNPRGPLGGTCGNVVDGRFVTGQISRRKKAQEIADKIMKELE